MDHVDNFVRLKIAACFDLSDCTDSESNQVVNNLGAIYLTHLGIELENLIWDARKLNSPKWLCSCGTINETEDCSNKSIEPKQCVREKAHKGLHSFIGEVSNVRCNHLEVITHTRVKWLEAQNKMASSETEDLFSKFYYHEKILIANMSSDEFKAHEEELAKVAFEAKARLTAVVDKKREDNAKLRGSQKEWLMPRSGAEDALVSDAIAAVGQRKKRMNKIEKLNEQLAGFVDDETRKMLIANIERKAADSSVNLISFVKAKTDESMVEDLKAKVEEKKESTPFDPSKLSGLFKKE